MRNTRYKKISLFGFLVFLLFFASVFSVDYFIKSKSQSFIFSKIEDVPKSQAVLILGAKVYENGRLSDMFLDRVLTAIDLYKNKKVDKFLISGDHGRKDYDEVDSAKNFLVENGISEEIIFLDHAGFDTYDSMYRAKEIFNVQSIIISTQDFHLPRSVFIARSLRIEAYGLKADKRVYDKIGSSERREIFAKLKAFLDVALESKPKFLGNPIPISGDAKLSW